jgi:hypothetical protein
MAISVDPVFLVTNECIAVTSAMRKNTRWAQSGVAAILGAPVDEGDGLASRLGLRSRSHNIGQVFKSTVWFLCVLLANVG